MNADQDPEARARGRRLRAFACCAALSAFTACSSPPAAAPPPPPARTTKAAAATAAPPAAEPERPRITVEGIGRGSIASFALRSDGRALAVARGREVEIWDVDDAALRVTATLDSPPAMMAFAADGASLQVAFVNRSTSIDLSKRIPGLASEPVALGPLRGISAESRIGVEGLSAEERRLFLSWAKQLKARVFEQRGALWAMTADGQEPLLPRVSRDGKLVVGRSGRDDVYMRLDTGMTFRVGPWAHGRYKGQLVRADPDVWFGPSSDIVLAVSASFTAPRSPFFAGKLYDTRKGKPIADVAVTCERGSATWSFNGRTLLLTRCARNAFVAYDAATGRELARLDGAAPQMNASGTRVALRTDDGAVVVRALPGGERALTVPGQSSEEPSDIAWTSDLRALIRVEPAGVSRLDLATLERRSVLERTPNSNRIAWDSAERVFPVATDDGTAVVDLTSQKTIRVIADTAPEERVAIRPDGKAIALAENEATKVTVWPLPEGKPLVLVKVPRPDDYVSRFAWSSDSRLLAVGFHPAGHVDIYDAVARKRLLRLITGDDKIPAGEQISVASLAFLPETHTLFVERLGPFVPGKEQSREIQSADCDSGKLLWKKAIPQYPRPALFQFAQDRSALFTWEHAEAGGAEQPGIGVRDVESEARLRFLPMGPDDAEFRDLHVPRLLLDAARGKTMVDAVQWAMKGAGKREAVTLAANGAFAVRARPDGMTLVRRADGAELRVIDGVVGRSEIAVFVDAEGHFDGSAESLPWLRGYLGKQPLGKGALAALHKPGLLKDFLAAAK